MNGSSGYGINVMTTKDVITLSHAHDTLNNFERRSVFWFCLDH